ncbi:hypothetical protein BV22DRAFT_1135470 [Leucogyrophana mollusca]|uniref:Uncharacterized protein n=1 Tax=Leucogyrophana mollusca TaxID=85980 RepID=A0ACB8AWL8_9AGAM|nr:hypothetical protein BV22DRAFT_1135470 [Leucogyrophana mollusca]
MGYTYGPHDIISQVPRALPEDVAPLTPYPEDPATHVRDSPSVPAPIQMPSPLTALPPITQAPQRPCDTPSCGGTVPMNRWMAGCARQGE